MKITEFQGPYRFLSNFWPACVEFEGVTYPSVENAYQAAKTLIIKDRVQFINCTAGQAKRASRTLQLRSDWEQMKLVVMEDLVKQKFTMSKELKYKLLSTCGAELIEGNNWNDTFWGVCRGKGLNHLGIILMKVRNTLGGELL